MRAGSDESKVLLVRSLGALFSYIARDEATITREFIQGKQVEGKQRDALRIGISNNGGLRCASYWL
jgi:hypothetical protein